MNEKYYIRIRGEMRGPFPVDRLHGLARRGKFGQHHHVSLDGVTWESATEHPELFPITPPQLPGAMGSEMGAASDQRNPASESRNQSGEQQWFYTIQGVQHGPISFSELKDLASTGQLKMDDYIFTESMPDWALASDVPDFPPHLSSQESHFSIDTSQGSGRNSTLRRSSDHFPTAPMAVASLVLGILGVSFPFLVLSALMNSAGQIALNQIDRSNILLDVSLFFLVSSILSIVFGHIALRQIDSSNSSLGGRKISLAGLILGYSVIGVCTTAAFIVFFIAGHRI